MQSRTKKAVMFGAALAIGFALFDLITLGTVDPVRAIGCGIIGGALYGLMLKFQGR